MPKHESLIEFYQGFQDEILFAADTETSGWTTDDFLTSVMLEYLEETGEVNDPIVCPSSLSGERGSMSARVCNPMKNITKILSRKQFLSNRRRTGAQAAVRWV